MKIKEQFLKLGHIIFPNYCSVCGTPITANSILCLRCNYEMPLTRFHSDYNNKTANVLAGRIKFERATSLLYYNKHSFFTRPIHQLKYNGRKHIGVELGRMLGSELLRAGWDEEIDCLVPVPLHKIKLKKRGYNQCSEIAKGMAEIMRKPVIENCLIRTKHSESQTRKGREERWENLRDSFCLEKPGRIEGKHVLLVDDIITTGATIEATGNLLCLAPAKLSIASIGISDN
jgi:ComF family protein